MSRRTFGRAWLGWSGATLLVLTLAACGGGSGGDDGGTGGGGGTTPPGTPQPPPGAPVFSLDGYDPLPGVVLTLAGTYGGTGPGGNFQPGDVVTVQFTLKSDAGVTLDLTAMDSGSAYLSGPTFNYNVVIPRKDDLRTASVYLGNATWQYTFPVPLPATYAAPYNDTASFGAADGELTGQALLAGTYSIGLETSKVYTIDGVDSRDPGSLVANILLLSATTLDTREVVTQAHCNQCHSDLRFHGDRRVGAGLCVLCHTSGAEDRNNPAVEGGTPGVSIDFKVMIHKIHMGKHLPSVLGMTTDVAGNRVYGAGTPYKLVGFSTTDASGFAFPVWPSLNIGMPRDFGYTALSAPNKAKEDEFARGVVACSKCHGDPDGAGPIVAPAQGALHETQPSRAACGACHDDIDWSKPYVANQDSMIANPPVCNTCHPAATTGIGLYPVRQAHVHPLLNPTINPGLNFNVTAVGEAGAHNGDGNVDPGEKLTASFTLTDDAGVPVAPATLNSFTAVIAGPTKNYNLVLNASVPAAHPSLAAGVGGPPPVYTFNVPEAVLLERVGLDTGAVGEVFGTLRSPHLAVTGATTTVYSRTATGFAGAADPAKPALQAMQNYIDVTPGQGASFIAGPPAAGNAAYTNLFIVIDDGNLASPVGAPAFPPPPTVTEEYARIIWRDGDRLWLASPLRVGHAAGVSVKLVTLTARTLTTHYTLTASTGTITEVADSFASQTVICSYTSDFIMPSLFPPPLNDSPELGEAWGEWKAKPVVKGTYTLDLYGYLNRVVNLQGESQTYRGTSVAGDVDFLVIDHPNPLNPVLEPYAVISAAENCYKCHNELFFHGGGRRSFGTCIMCHGGAGAEDRPRWASSNGPETPGTTISFRTMLHKIHMGEHLTNALTYTVVGFGGTAYTYGEVVFPAWPRGVRECTKCHGNDAWKAPTNRDHPTAMTVPARVWRSVCGACHDSTAAAAHIDSNTSPAGYESCEICHGAGRDADVAKHHGPR